MHTKALLVGVMVLVSTALNAAQAPGKPDESKASKGQMSYKVYCGSCHGSSLQGDGPLAKDMKVRPADLTGLSKRNEGEFPFKMVMDTIDHGRSVRGHGSQDMPAWGDAFKMTEQTEAAAREKMVEIAHYLWTKQVQ